MVSLLDRVLAMQFRCDLVGADFQLCHSIITSQVVLESKYSFDNQLKIQKLKDTIFAVNEHS